MASGSSGRGGNSGSKGFDFGSDDILCSYEDYGNQEEENGTRSDSSIGVNLNKEFHKSRIARTSVFPTSTYGPPEESTFNQDVFLTVENTMKKYTDDLMRFLEGISSRLSQLELYCYNLDKSIGEMRSDLIRNHDESESKLKSLEKHIQEVHRSVQILRDKQELADTQKELAKLQLAQKESSSTSNALLSEEKASLPTSEEKRSDNSSEVKSQQLVIAPHHAASQPSLPTPTRPVEYQQPAMTPPSSVPSQTMAPGQAYYIPSQISNQHGPPPQTQYLPPAQSQMPDFPWIAPQPAQPQINQNPQIQPLPPHQQQWQPPHQQPVQPPQPVLQPQIRSSSPSIYSSYLSNQPPSELPTHSVPMQMSYAGSSQPGSIGPDTMTYGYGVTGSPIQPQPSSQNLKAGFVLQSGDRYVPVGPRPALPPGTAYMIFDGEGGRTHPPPAQQHFRQGAPVPHFPQGAYPPSSIPLNPQLMPGANMLVPQSTHNHPYNELIEKLVAMGYRGDLVFGVIQRMEESGHPIDFKAVLDMLNGHSAGGSQSRWSG